MSVRIVNRRMPTISARSPENRTVDQHIAQLRKKIEINPQEPEIIQTVHGVGYKFGK